MAKTFAGLLSLALLCLIHGAAGAQQSDRAPNLNLGDAVVSGFSGTLSPDPAHQTRGKSAVDLTFINPDGPSARVIDLSRPGYIWDGRVFTAPKKFDVLAKDVGQVFGVALDDQPQPNIYLAATSLFGLQIIVRGRDGLPQRRKIGGPGAGWMKGQFGLDLQGGPGAIYRVDGRTGAVTLFANVTLNGVPNPGPSLGNLAYDAAHRQLFVSDLYTGMIHRLDLDGRDLGSYDHGVTGLGAAKLPPLPFNPGFRLNIASDRFDSENPATWGFAPPGRQVFGLAVYQGRLYYSVLAGPQIWSIGIQDDGGFAADPRWELDVPAQSGPLAVSDIAFSQQGQMILAQRATLVGSYDYSAFTKPGEPRVLRFSLKGPNDPPSPGRWNLVPDEYAVGFAGNYRNTNGGVALGYGYGLDGVLNTAACEQSLWTTGQKLRDDPARRSELDPGGPLLVDGLQGSPAGPTREFNAPPTTSYFVDYDDAFDDARATGHIGSVRILSRPCPPPVTAPRRPLSRISIPATIVTTTGTPPVCTPTCVCPPGTVDKDGECVKAPPPNGCPDPMVPGPVPGSCICPPGYTTQNGTCVKVDCTPTPTQPCGTGTGTGTGIGAGGGPQLCTPPMIPGPAPGSCRCPDGTVQQGRTCVPTTNACRPPKIPGPCECPPGLMQKDGMCVPRPTCPAPMIPGADPATCVCPPSSVLDGDKCVPATPIDLGVKKDGGTTPAPAGYYAWTITVTNTGAAFNGTGGVITITDVLPPGMSFTSVSDGLDWSCPTSVPVGGTLTCTYIGSGPPSGPLTPISINGFIPGNGPFPPITNCATVAVDPSSGLQDTDASNDQGCATVTKPPMSPAACKPPMVPGAVPGSCICPSGMTQNGQQCVTANACRPPMVPGAVPGSCICPTGTTQNGDQCVPQTACPLPMVPGAAPGVCSCPTGTVQKGTECIKEVRSCPDGMVRRGSKCVERERKKPKEKVIEREHPRNDIPEIRRGRDLPGGFGGGRFGGGGHGGGFGGGGGGQGAGPSGGGAGKR